MSGADPCLVLQARLSALKQQYDAATKGAKRARLAAHASLIAVIDFMNSMPGWRGLDFALVPLVAALDDIEHGRKADWLVPSNEGGRPPVPVTVSAVRGRCAGMMELLMRAGQRREAAARTVLANLPKDAVGKIGASSWKAVAGWRDEVTGTGEPSAERDSYYAMLALAETKMDAKKSVKAVLRAVARSLD